MIYRIIAFEDYKKEKPIIIHEPSASYGAKLIKAEMDEELNMITEVNIQAPIDNPFYQKFQGMKTCIEVINIRTNEKVFDGRCTIPEGSMNDSGLFSSSVTFESKMGYLHDSTQEYRTTQLTGTREYLEILINNHNKQVEPHKRFKVRNVTVGKDKVYRSIGYKSTFETIKDKLIDRLGGYLVYEEVNGVMYLDYLQDYGEKKQSPIQISQNLLSASKKQDLTDMATVIVPLGAEIPKDSDEGMQKKESDFSKERYTIKSVNGGSIQLIDKKLHEEFGHIRKEIIYPNTENPSVLKSQGDQYLKNQRIALIDWDISVVEQGLIDDKYDIFKIGNYHLIDNEYLSPHEILQIVAKKTDLIEPIKTNLTIGNKNKSFSQFQNEMNSQIIKPKIDSQVQVVSENVKIVSSKVDDLEKQRELLLIELEKQNEQNSIFSDSIEEQQKIIDELNKKIEELRKEQTHD